VPLPTHDIHCLALDEVDASRTESAPAPVSSTSPSFLVVPSASNSSKFKGTPAPRTGKVLRRGAAGTVVRKDLPSTPTPTRKAVSQATRDICTNRPGYSQVPRVKLDARVLKRRPIPSFLPTSSEDGNYSSSIRPPNAHTKVDSESNSRTSNCENRSTTTTEHASVLDVTHSTNGQTSSFPQHDCRPSSSDINTIVRSPIESPNTELRRALSTSNRHTSSRPSIPPETNAKLKLWNPAVSSVSRVRNLRSALGITESTKTSGETRPSHLNSDDISQSQIRNASANKSSSSHTSSSSPTVLSPNFSTQAVAGDSQYNLSLSSKPAWPPLPYATTTQPTHAPPRQDQDSTYSDPQNARTTSATPSDASFFAKTKLRLNQKPKHPDTFAHRSPRRHSILSAHSHGRDVFNQSPASELREYHLDARSPLAGASLTREPLSEVRPPSRAADRQFAASEDITMFARVLPMTSPVLQPRSQMTRSPRFSGDRRALDNLSSRLESLYDHRNSAAESQPALYVSALRLDSRTYNKPRFNSTHPGKLSNASTAILPELRPADSVSQLGDLPESTSKGPEHVEIPLSESNDSSETGSSLFSISSSFNGTHLPDLPPLPSITSSPALSNDAIDDINSRSNRVSLSRIPRRVSTEKEPEAAELNHDAARLRQAVEIEKSELIARDTMAPGTAPLHRSWNEKILAQGGFDPVAQRLLSAAEYHQLVDGTSRLFNLPMLYPSPHLPFTNYNILTQILFSLTATLFLLKCFWLVRSTFFLRQNAWICLTPCSASAWMCFDI
jgi:hypothetical protein